MKFSDLTRKAQETLKDEAKTDKFLDMAAGAASKATKGKYDDKIRTARDAADKKLGSE